MSKNKTLILEDVIYFTQEGDKIKSTAEETFYYTFLIQRANATRQGTINLRAAEDFAIYQRIYSYMMERGYLTNPKYFIDFDRIEGGACFSLNLSRLMEDVDLESELLEQFEGELISDYIHTLCNPADSLRCHYCGAISLSRVIHDDIDGQQVPCCLACHPLSKELKASIKSEYDARGSADAVEKRFDLIIEHSRAVIPDGKSINTLIAEYKRDNQCDVQDVRVAEIRSILDELRVENFDVFSTYDNDILMINMESIQDIDIYSEVVGIDFETGEIVVFFQKDGVVMLDDAAYQFAKTLKEKHINKEV